MESFDTFDWEPSQFLDTASDFYIVMDMFKSYQRISNHEVDGSYLIG